MDFLPRKYWWAWKGVHFAIAKSLSWRRPGEPTTWFGPIETHGYDLRHFVIGPLLISWKATHP